MNIDKTKPIKRYCLNISLAILIVFAPFLSLSTKADTWTQYQRRGQYHEGVKPDPRSGGNNVELVSFLADYQETSVGLPDTLKIRFYLTKSEPTYLTIRELDYKYFYWLDRVNPSVQWRQGFNNQFEWSARVLKAIDKEYRSQVTDQIEVYELGVLARLKYDKPAPIERLAPVVLFHHQLPKRITGYRLTAMLPKTGRIECSVLKAGSEDVVWKEFFPHKEGGRPFTVKWDASDAEAGSYIFKINGFFLDDNGRILQEVRFFHQPSIQ